MVVWSECVIDVIYMIGDKSYTKNVCRFVTSCDAHLVCVYIVYMIVLGINIDTTVLYLEIRTTCSIIIILYMYIIVLCRLKVNTKSIAFHIL